MILFFSSLVYYFSPKQKLKRSERKARREEEKLKLAKLELEGKKIGRPPKPREKDKQKVEIIQPEILDEESPYKEYVYWRPRWTWDIRVWFNPLVWVKVWKWRRWRKKALKRIVARIQTSPTEVIQLMFSVDKSNSFVWNKGRYICDDKTAKYNMTAKMEEFYFHKDISLSLDVNVDPNKVLNVVKDSKLIHVWHDLDPRVLQQWTEAEAARVALMANSIGEFFKRMFGISVVTLFVLIVFVILYGFQSGFFERLGS